MNTKKTKLLFVVFLACTMAFSTVLLTPAQAQNLNPKIGQWQEMGNNGGHTGFQNGPAPNTPHIAWQTYCGGDIAGGAASVGQGLVFVGTESTGVVALNETTGAVAWRWNDTYNWAENPQYIDGMVITTRGSYAPSAENASIAQETSGQSSGAVAYNLPDQVVGLNATTGKVVWTVDSYGDATLMRVYDHRVWIIGDYLNRTSNSVIHVPGFNTIDAVTGQVTHYNWGTSTLSFDGRNAFGMTNDLYRNVSLSQPGTVYLFSMNIDNMTLNWEVPLPASAFWTSLGGGGMMVGYGCVYLVGTEVIRVDEGTGAIIWDNPTGLQPSQWVTPISLSYGKVMFYAEDGNVNNGSASCTSTVYAMNAFSGSMTMYGIKTQFEWKTTIGMMSEDLGLSGGCVADGKLYMCCLDGRTYCLSVATGEILWTADEAGPNYLFYSLADGGLYVATLKTNGLVYCFSDAPASSMSLSAPASETVGTSVTMTGKLTDSSGNGVANAAVSLQEQNPSSAGSWLPLATVTTGSDGTFSYSYTPVSNGQYNFVAAYSEPCIGGYASSNATAQVGVTQVTIDMNPINNNLDSINGHLNSVNSNITTLQTYLIAVIAVLVILGVVVIVLAVMRMRKTRS